MGLAARRQGRVAPVTGDLKASVNLSVDRIPTIMIQSNGCDVQRLTLEEANALATELQALVVIGVRFREERKRDR
jgi:hypothetical protein